MIRRCTALCGILAVLLCLISCAAPDKPETVSTEPGLVISDVAGVWSGDNAPFSYLVLEEDGTYRVLSESGEDKNGGFIAEGEYIVLDGYGVDDPDLYLSLRFDAARDALISEGSPASFTLSRTQIRREEPESDPKEWYGKYTSDLGTLSVGQGAAEGTMLIALTPTDGVTMSASVTLDSAVSASCGMFTLTRDDAGIVLRGLEEEFIPLSGTYTK